MQCRIYELTVGQVGIGSAWQLCVCCAAVTLVSGTSLALGLHPRSVNVFIFSLIFSSKFFVMIHIDTIATTGLLAMIAVI